MAREPGPIGTGYLYADLEDLTEGGHPGGKLTQAFVGGREACRTEQPPPFVDDRCDVGFLVGVHPADDNLRFAWHAGTCLPLIRWGSHHRQVGGQDTHGVFKAPIKSRPSGPLVHVPGEELDRQINIKARSQSHNEGQAQPLLRGLFQYESHTPDQ